MKKFWLGFFAGILFSFLAMMAFGYFWSRMIEPDQDGLWEPALNNKQGMKQLWGELLLKDLRTDSVIGDTFFNNKVLFLNFWEHWCVPCKKELPSLQRLYNTVNDSSIFFAFISTEDPAKTRKDTTVENYRLPFYYTDKILPQALKHELVPRTYIVDKRKNIVVAELGAARWDTERVASMIDSLKSVE